MGLPEVYRKKSPVCQSASSEEKQCVDIRATNNSSRSIPGDRKRTTSTATRQATFISLRCATRAADEFQEEQKAA